MNISCPVCFLNYDEVKIPKIVPCGHTFCTVCIDSLFAIAQQSQDREPPICPLCRGMLPPDSDRIPINEGIVKLLTKLKKSHRDLNKKRRNLVKMGENIKVSISNQRLSEDLIVEATKRESLVDDILSNVDDYDKEMIVDILQTTRKLNSKLEEQLTDRKPNTPEEGSLLFPSFENHLQGSGRTDEEKSFPCAFHIDDFLSYEKYFEKVRFAFMAFFSQF